MKNLFKILVLVAMFFYSSCTQENFEFEEETCEINNYNQCICEDDDCNISDGEINSTIGEDGSVIEEDNED